MRPITDTVQVARYSELVAEMVLKEDGEECEFSPEWVRRHGWAVVPTESMARIPPGDIPRMVSVLRKAGYVECIAVVNEPGFIKALPILVPSEPLSSMATCYAVGVDELDFAELNRQLGLFRFLLMPSDRSWALSCNESYNLIAGKQDLLQDLLGKPIAQARREFVEFAVLCGGESAEEPLVRVSRHYASM